MLVAEAAVTAVMKVAVSKRPGSFTGSKWVRPRRRPQRCSASVLGSLAMPNWPSRSHTGAGALHGPVTKGGLTHSSPPDSREAVLPPLGQRHHAELSTVAASS